MKRVKIEGKVYDVIQEERPYYDNYFYKGELLPHAPIDTKVVGYVKEDDVTVAICKKSLVKYAPVGYGALGVFTLFVVGYMTFVLTLDIEVPHWVAQEISGDDVIGELDDGTVRVSKKFSYSQYATYDGSQVSVFYDTEDNKSEVAIRVGDITTDYRSMESGYDIPMELSLTPEQMTQATLLIKNGEDVSEYPLVIEYPIITEKPVLAVGTAQDNLAAYQQATGNMYTYDEEIENIEETEVDFSTFEVITYKPKNTHLLPDVYSELEEEYDE